MGWRPFDDGKTVGAVGSEEGTIVLDEEHELGARITFERGATNAPVAITCGIYGWLFHTCFLNDRVESERQFDAMKAALDAILSAIPDEQDPLRDQKVADVCDAIDRFVDRFP